MRKKETVRIHVMLHIHARLQEIHRQEIFEDRLESFLAKKKIGEVMGGGLWRDESGEIMACSVDMEVEENSIDRLIEYVKEMDILPKGSYLLVNKQIIEVGVGEGLALYLNGTDLDSHIYENCDVNWLISLLDDAIDGHAIRLSYYEGEKETAIYFYGKNYEDMKIQINPVIQKYPLCQKCRIKQIA